MIYFYFLCYLLLSSFKGRIKEEKQKQKQKRKASRGALTAEFTGSSEINWSLNRDVKNNSGIKYTRRSTLVLILATI